MKPGIAEWGREMDQLSLERQAMVARVVIAHIWLELAEHRPQIETAMARTMAEEMRPKFEHRRAAAAAGTTQGEK